MQRESEVGKMGQEVEAYFEELVEKFFPYIDLRAPTPTSVKSEGGKPKPKKIKRKNDEALLHVHWAILFQFINCWLCRGGEGTSVRQEEKTGNHALLHKCCCAINVGICLRSREDKIEDWSLDQHLFEDYTNVASAECFTNVLHCYKCLRYAALP